MVQIIYVAALGRNQANTTWQRILPNRFLGYFLQFSGNFSKEVYILFRSAQLAIAGKVIDGSLVLNGT
jgi:hypothetical protein